MYKLAYLQCLLSPNPLDLRSMVWSKKQLVKSGCHVPTMEGSSKIRSSHFVPNLFPSLVSSLQISLALQALHRLSGDTRAMCCGLASSGDAGGVDVWRGEAGNGGVCPGRLLLGRVSCWHGAAGLGADVHVKLRPLRGCTGGQQQGRSDAGEDAAGLSQARSAPTADGAATLRGSRAR
jgi:hypothetical protein